eukprot:4425634-Alexandrium_andersonii.AAC.1
MMLGSSPRAPPMAVRVGPPLQLRRTRRPPPPMAGMMVTFPLDICRRLGDQLGQSLSVRQLSRP